MKNKLRVYKKNEYVIEVNDNGDTISFNIEDPSLPLRAEKAYEDIQKLTENMKTELFIVSKRDDVKGNKILSKNEKETLEIYNKAFNDMRKAMDGFLGKGACQKIFGDTNYLTMYDDLFEQLTPHFENIGMSIGSLIESIKKKYGSDDDEETLEA